MAKELKRGRSRAAGREGATTSPASNARLRSRAGSNARRKSQLRKREGQLRKREGQLRKREGQLRMRNGTCLSRRPKQP